MNNENGKSRRREKSDQIKEHRCKNLIAVIENPTDVRNIGTVIRNVEALGVEKTYVVDKYNNLPEDWKEMRTHTSFTKPSSSAIKWSFVKKFTDSQSCMEHLETNGFVSVATSPHTKGKLNVNLDEADFTKHKKLAVWFGNEQNGLSEQAIECSESCVNIPMYGLTESLNLGTTTGIVLYEITKQRRKFVREKSASKRNA